MRVYGGLKSLRNLGKGPKSNLSNPHLVSAETQVDVTRDKYETYLKKELAERESFLEVKGLKRFFW